MHFVKTIVSLFALSSFAVAHIGDADLERRDVAEIAHEEYLMARDEYIEKRDLFRRFASKGTCRATKGSGKLCYKGGRACGPCTPMAVTGQLCFCNA
ncbi:unnamed protein product [Clonostachys chloroleuca]|uniref:Uncharacterized protein n=1 Tax=Clonostachys chloroleuca TaxID=1926264 RepID=A0AA35QEM2_9HYPO|nr:unnamed protein product [Clonostachys chloroleuca]